MKIGDVEVRDDVFNVKVKKHVLWEVVKWQLAKRRQGTHSTKTRGEVAYSGRKILPQKGTGNARHGERGVNIFVGGGVAHGPKPRDYEYPLPKRVRKLGLKMALSDKARNNAIIFVDNIDLGKKPKTKKAIEFLKNLGVEKEKVLVVIPEKADVLYKSFRNLPNVRVLLPEGLNVYDVLWANKLVIQKDCLDRIYKKVEA
ncbi:50S ribosomal protein L4 [Aquifex aeolicus]|uniref:Large ribosomal subunit protein uL4 n=1 Tax=Aquifex aeolicus (strain VF5) TaxID=224324 RepID=RL4_AQUAE|nr:50S ribosomal protein L4 [Aquifex aeolicus]O66432.1 RecName: Full=Large ribosomal subunit protein uL4; AltName: Full=50S ribosomal protein L4 [Aquifex aeolicus VF5]AAC06394.1 ribosomal protein L04 [Aquifex aeolicus VF5]